MGRAAQLVHPRFITREALAKDLGIARPCRRKRPCMPLEPGQIPPLTAQDLGRGPHTPREHAIARPANEVIDLFHKGKSADRIVRYCIIKEINPAGSRACASQVHRFLKGKKIEHHNGVEISPDLLRKPAPERASGLNPTASGPEFRLAHKPQVRIDPLNQAAKCARRGHRHRTLSATNIKNLRSPPNPRPPQPAHHMPGMSPQARKRPEKILQELKRAPRDPKRSLHRPPRHQARRCHLPEPYVSCPAPNRARKG